LQVKNNFYTIPLTQGEQLMDKRKTIALAGVIFLVGIAGAAFFIVSQPPGESDQAAPLPAEDQGAPENSARTEKGVSPLLLILIFIVVLATATKIGRMVAKGKGQ
jgi:hypothetical protein